MNFSDRFHELSKPANASKQGQASNPNQYILPPLQATTLSSESNQYALIDGRYANSGILPGLVLPLMFQEQIQTDAANRYAPIDHRYASNTIPAATLSAFQMQFPGQYDASGGYTLQETQYSQAKTVLVDVGTQRPLDGGQDEGKRDDETDDEEIQIEETEGSAVERSTSVVRGGFPAPSSTRNHPVSTVSESNSEPKVTSQHESMNVEEILTAIFNKQSKSPTEPLSDLLPARALAMKDFNNPTAVSSLINYLDSQARTQPNGRKQ